MKSETCRYKEKQECLYPKIYKILINSVRNTESKYSCFRCKPNKCSCDSKENSSYYWDLENEINRIINIEINKDKVIRITEDGFPLELYKNRPIINILRRIKLTKYKIKYSEWIKKGGYIINFN